MAEGLGDLGAKLVITARKQGELDEAAAHLRARGAEVATLACDLSKLDGVPDLAGEALAAFGTVDLLVNNAGATWGRRRRIIRPTLG